RLVLLASLLLAHGAVWLPWLYAVTVLATAAGRFFIPARTVLLAPIVDGPRLPRAQSLLQTSQAAALVTGPAVGSALLLVFGPAGGIGIDAVSFGLSALALLFLRARSVPARSVPARHLQTRFSL